MYKIREATESDFPSLQRIWEEAVEATHGFLAREDFDFYKYRLRRYFREVELFIYEDASGIGGFAGVSNKKLEMLFVSKRGSGIGSRLLEYAIAHRFVREIDVNEQNSKALAFYVSKGFTVCGRQQKDCEGLPYPIINLELKETIE